MMDFRLIELQEVDSTNLYASRLLQDQTVEEGTVIVAAAQSDGKGQGQNRWLSEPGKNLTFTVVWHPRFLPAENQFLLSEAIALGVCDFLSCYSDEVSVKWPNDLLIAGKKAGGILIQHTVQGEQIETTIAGIGINVNQTLFPASLPSPISLAQRIHRKLNLRESLMQALGLLDHRYNLLKQGDYGSVRQDYLRMLNGFGEEKGFMVNGRHLKGVIHGVDGFGRLLVAHAGQPVRAYSHGEIGWSVVPLAEGEAEVDG